MLRTFAVVALLLPLTIASASAQRSIEAQPLPPLVGGFTALGIARQRGNAEVARILGEARGRE